MVDLSRDAYLKTKQAPVGITPSPKVLDLSMETYLQAKPHIQAKKKVTSEIEVLQEQSMEAQKTQKNLLYRAGAFIQEKLFPKIAEPVKKIEKKVGEIIEEKKPLQALAGIGKKVVSTAKKVGESYLRYLTGEPTPGASKKVQEFEKQRYMAYDIIGMPTGKEAVESAKHADWMMNGMTLGYYRPKELIYNEETQKAERTEVDATPQNTKDQASRIVGSVMTYMFANSVIGGAINKIPFMKPLYAKALLKPWKVGYPLAISVSGVTGLAIGAISYAQDYKQRLENTAKTAGWYMIFTGVAYPIQQLFRPVITKEGKVTVYPTKDTPALMNKMTKEVTAGKPLYFRSPNDPDLYIKVTPYDVTTGNVKSLGIKPYEIKTIKDFTKVDIELFKSNPSLFSQMVNFVSGKRGPYVTVPLEAPEIPLLGMPGKVAPAAGAGPVPITPAEPVIPKPPVPIVGVEPTQKVTSALQENIPYENKRYFIGLQGNALKEFEKTGNIPKTEQAFGGEFSIADDYGLAENYIGETGKVIEVKIKEGTDIGLSSTKEGLLHEISDIGEGEYLVSSNDVIEIVQAKGVGKIKTEEELKKQLDILDKEHDELVKNRASAKQLEEMVDKKQVISKQLYPVEIRIKPNGEGQIDFFKANNGWYDSEIFYDGEGYEKTRNELGKKINAHLTETGGSGNMAFTPTDENIKLVTDSLEQHGYKVQMDKGVGEVDKQLQPLAKEAMKYDSAEEFVNFIEKDIVGRIFEVPVGMKGMTKVEQNIIQLQDIVNKNFIKKPKEITIKEARATFEKAKAEGKSWAKGRSFENPEVQLRAINEATPIGIDVGIGLQKSQLIDFYTQVKGVKVVKPEVLKIGDYVRAKPEFARGKKIEGEIIKRTIEARAGFPAIYQIKSPTGELFELGVNKLEKIPEVKPALEIAPKAQKGVKEAVLEKKRVKPQLPELMDEIDEIIKGRRLMRLPSREVQKDWRETIGNAAYMRIFRKSNTLPTPDEMADELGISENELREKIDNRLRSPTSTKTYEVELKEYLAGDLHTDTLPLLSDTEINQLIPEIEQEESIFEAIETEIGKEQKGMLDPAALIKGLYSPIRDLWHKFYDWIWTFGEVRRTDPELYDKLMKAFSKRNAGVDQAIDRVEKIIKDIYPKGMSSQDAAQLSLYYEDSRLDIPDHLKNIFKEFENLFKQIERKIFGEGILAQSFQERMIIENQGKIEELMGQLKHPEKSKRIAELKAEIEEVQNMRYLPHNIVAQRALEQKFQTLEGEQKKVFLKGLEKVSSKFKMRTGRSFLKDYLESGLIEPADIDIRRLAANTIRDYYYKSSMQDVYNYAQEKGLIKDSTLELRKKGWLGAREIGISSPELKHKLVHPMMASALAEMKLTIRGKRHTPLRQALGAVKIGQFFKPTIVWFYDVIQKYMRGAYSFNPVKEARYLAKAFKTVVGKTPDFHLFNKHNLYQFPYETPKASVEEAVKMMVRKTSKDVPNYVKKIESITGMSWAKGDIKPFDLLMLPFRTIANYTWMGDKILRTQSTYILQDMGYSVEEAVKIAGRAHGAYSEISPKFKETVSPYVFVYSFRILMPVEMMKMATEPTIGILRAKAQENGKRVSRKDLERWAKAILATLIIPIATDLYLKSRGFEKDKWMWKWKKSVEVQGKKQEVVVGMNFIMNMPIKWWHRLTYYNPIDPQNRLQQGITNFVRWEIHPLWRIFLWDIAQNRKSFGSGDYVYDPNAELEKQIWQISTYTFANSFRFWGLIMDDFSEGNRTTKEKEDQKEVLNQALTKFDRVLLSTFGYTYTRMDVDKRRVIMKKSLENEASKRRYIIIKKYEGEERTKQLKEWKSWYNRCKEWIENEYH